MRVVIERTPADTARILWIRRQLIVDSCITQRVLALPFVVIGCFCREGMTYELRVEIARMIRLLEGKSEVVHGEDIFKELRSLKTANAAGLPGGVKRVSQRVRASVEGVVVP